MEKKEIRNEPRVLVSTDLQKVIISRGDFSMGIYSVIEAQKLIEELKKAIDMISKMKKETEE